MNKRSNHVERIEPKVSSMPTIEEGLSKLIDNETDNLRSLAMAEISARQQQNEQDAPYFAAPVPQSLDPRYGFVKLAMSLAESIVEAAQIQFNEAENNLQRAKTYAEQLRASIEAQDRELADCEDRLKKFGTRLMQAHDNFHNGEPIEQPALAQPAPAPVETNETTGSK